MQCARYVGSGDDQQRHAQRRLGRRDAAQDGDEEKETEKTGNRRYRLDEGSCGQAQKAVPVSQVCDFVSQNRLDFVGLEDPWE